MKVVKELPSAQVIKYTGKNKDEIRLAIASTYAQVIDKSEPFTDGEMYSNDSMHISNPNDHVGGTFLEKGQYLIIHDQYFVEVVDTID